MSNPPAWFLYGAAFVSGMATLGIEMATSRLIGAVLGTSDLVWTAVITLVLIYLTLGYAIGGRWADRSNNPLTFFRLLSWAAFAAGLLPILARPLMLKMTEAFLLADLDVVMLAVVGLTVAALFAVPVTLLGCVSPFVIRLLVSDAERAGNVAGRVYALSTVGSILGTFSPVLLLIPLLGTAWTFAVFSSLLLLMGLVGQVMVRSRSVLWLVWMPLVLAVAWVGGMRGPIKPAPAGTTLLYEAETPYNLVQVVEVDPGVVIARQQPGTRMLLLNEGQGVHSVYHPEIVATQATWDMFLAAPYFNPAPHNPSQVQKIGIIGLAAGTIAQQYTNVYGSVAIDGIEIDPGIVDAGRQFFDMNMPNLNVLVEDGRYGLAQLSGGYDLVAIDAYRVPYIPWHLTTVEFFQEVREKLSPDGVVMINVGRAASDRRLVEALVATMETVYASVHAIDVPYSFNTMLVGTPAYTTAENLAQNLAMLPDDAPPFLRDTLALAYQNLVPAVPSDVIFTDDRAPVETLINSMIVEFVLGDGNLARLQE